MGLLAVALLATVGGPVFAVVAQRLAVSRKKVFLDKLGRQVATMALALAVGTLPFSGGMWVLSWAREWYELHTRHPELRLPDFSPLLAGEPSLYLAGVFVLVLVLLGLYVGLWNRLKGAKGVHALLGGICGLAAMALLFGILSFARAVRVSPLLGTADGRVLEFLTLLPLHDPGSVVWPLWVEALLTSLAAAGALGLPFLLLRRGKDDFGRDYYQFAMRFTASWAFWNTLFQALALVWAVWTLGRWAGGTALGTPLMFFPAAALVMQLAACLLWSFVRRAENPLRAKPSVILAAVLFAFSLSAQGAFLALVP